MPKQNVPEIGSSTGMKGFPTLDAGTYGLSIQNCKVTEVEDQPADQWLFNCIIKYGPPLPSGKPSFGQRYSNRVTILRREHLDFEEKKDFGVDQLKSWADAAGVPVEKNGINNDLFAGMEVEADLSKTPDKKDKEHFYNNVRAIRAIGEDKTKAKATGTKRGRKPKDKSEE